MKKPEGVTIRREDLFPSGREGPFHLMVGNEPEHAPGRVSGQTLILDRVGTFDTVPEAIAYADTLDDYDSATIFDNNGKRVASWSDGYYDEEDEVYVLGWFPF